MQRISAGPPSVIAQPACYRQRSLSAPLIKNVIPETLTRSQSSGEVKSLSAETPLAQRSLTPTNTHSEPAPLTPKIPWGTSVNAATAKAALITIFDLPIHTQFEVLGEGRYADVSAVTINSTRYAIKLSKAEKGELGLRLEKNCFTTEQGEICGLKVPPHPNIVKTHALLLFNYRSNQYSLINDINQIPQEDEANFVVRASIQEFVTGENLFTCIVDEHLHEGAELAVNIGLQVAKALQHIHDNEFIYRDLKPENITYDQETGNIKLVDLGLLKPLPLRKTTTTLCGTPEYYTPEVFLNQPYNHTIDNFSLGWLLYELTTDEVLLHDENIFAAMASRREYCNKDASERQRTIIESNHEAFIGHDELARIISLLTCETPDERMSLSDAIRALQSHQQTM